MTLKAILWLSAYLPWGRRLQRGQGLVEYALILSMLVLVAAVTLGGVGDSVTSMYSISVSKVVSALSKGGT